MNTTNYDEKKEYPSKSLEIDAINEMMINIHNNFFSLDSNFVRQTIEFITKNINLLEKNFENRNSKYEDILIQYHEKILPLKEFLGKDIKKDSVMIKIKDKTIRSKKLLTTLFNKTEPQKILRIFNNDIVDLIRFLKRVDYLDETEKQTLFNHFADRLLNDKYFKYLLPLLSEQHTNIFSKNYLTKRNFESLINMVIYSSPINLDENILNYLLDNEYVNISFITNLIHMLNYDKELEERDKKIYEIKINKILEKYHYKSIEESGLVEIKETDSLDTVIEKTEKYELSGKTIEFEIAIELLRGYLKQQIKLSKYSIKQMIKSIGIHLLKEMDVPINGIYFVDNTRYKGAYIAKNKSIEINTLLTLGMYKKTNSLYEKLTIFITLFHEMRHAKINNDISNRVYDIENYEMVKENILMDYDKNFYDTNYRKINHEMDARIAGFDMLAKFIEIYFPELLDKVQDEVIADLEKEQKEKQEQNKEPHVEVFKTIEINFQQAFDTLMKYNSSILKKHPIFNLEYHSDGTVKTYEEILAQRTDENIELIENILKNRYSNFSQDLFQETFRIRKTR